MNKNFLAALCAVCALAPLTAHAQDVEDEPIFDEPVPAAPQPAAPENQAPAVGNPAVQVPVAPPAAGNPAAGNGETITIPRAVWEQLLRDVDDLKKTRSEAATEPAVESTTSTTGVSGNRNYLALPDISLILQGKGAFSSDNRDEGRRRFNLSEAELAIQGYVYPNVKADAFIVGAPSEGESFGLEEGFLTFQGVRKGLNINLGRKFTPFGRTGELHNHSFLYPRQLLPIQNLVTGEALIGDGIGLNYLLPLKGKTFVRASLGAWSGEGTETLFNSTPGDPFFGGIGTGTGAGFTRRFYTGRLWAGRALGQDGEFELGVSRAQGRSSVGDDTGAFSEGSLRLTGLDASYRRFMGGGKRLLLRSEYFRYKPKGLFTSSATGYYALASLRFDPRKDIGLLYENSGFPQSPGDRENALSLIYTKQLTEQFYGRVMATRGDRPGGKYNELRLQFTAGLGPHTHTLE